MGWDKVPSNMELWVYLEKFFYRLYDFLSQNKQTMTLQRCFLLVFTGTMSWEDAVLLWIGINKKITLNFLFSDHLKNLSVKEAIVIAQNHSLWRLIYTFGTKHSQ